MTPKTLSLNLSNLRPLLSLLAVVWLLGVLGFGWLVKSFLILMGLLLLAPILAFVGFRWWLQRNLIQERCPVCGFEVAGLNGTQVQCSNCGEQLIAQQGHFRRLTPPGTIDVQAIDVSVQSLED